MLIAALFLLAAAPNNDNSAASDDARLLGDLVAASAAKVPNVDVLTGEDVRKAASVEADKALLGCSEQSCLAEIANAMGAAVVLYGNVGHLAADDIVLTLSLFDSERASSGGRDVIRGATLKEVADQIDARVQTLVKSGLGARAKAARVRLLVLDLDTRGGAASAAAAAPPPPPWLALGGGVLAAVGVLGVVGGVLFDLDAVAKDKSADDPKTTQKDASALYTARNQSALFAGLGYVGGGVLALAGGAMALVGVME